MNTDLLFKYRKFWNKYHPTYRKKDGMVEDPMVLPKSKEPVELPLMERVEVLQDALNFMEEGIMILNGKGEMVYCSQGLIELLQIDEDGWSQGSKDGIGDSFHCLLMDPKGFFQGLEDRLSKGKDSSLECRLKDGRYLQCQIRHHQWEGMEYQILRFKDVTRQKDYSHLLWENRRIHKLLLDHIPDALVVEEGMRCLYANHSAARLFGYHSPQKMIGKDLGQCLTEESRKRYLGSQGEGRDGGNAGSPFELVVKGEDRSRWVEVTNYSYPCDNRLKLTILKDVTEEKLNRDLWERIQKNEEALAKKNMQERLSSEFYSNLSHDLKTPVNVISIIGKMLKSQQGNLNSSVKRYVEILENNCQRLIKIVNESILLDRVENECLNIRRQPCKMIELLEEITQSIIPYAEEKGIQVIFDTNAEECIVETDANLIERVLLNLLSNSLKFTPEGGNILVSVEVSKEELTILVQDSGVGIQKDELPFIFDRYRRASNSKDHRGNGIGLYIAKKFVEVLGGRIDVSSERGRGSIFKVILPLGEGDVFPMEVEGNT